MAYTKKTVTVATEPINQIWNNMITSYPESENIFFDKVNQLVSEGKTDGILYKTSANIAVRLWIDLAAAEEWVAFTTATMSSYSDINYIQSVTIENNVDDGQ